MDSDRSAGQAEDGRDGWFATTHWSLVLAAGDSAAPGAREALETLCGTYWPALYAYVRRYGYAPEDAKDLTQEFFARFLAKKYFRLARRERGKFRTFLLTSLKHFLVSEWEKAHTAKRGGGPVLSLDQQTAEAQYLFEPADGVTPDLIYDRRWAAALLERVKARLRQECESFGKLALFDHLEGSLWGEKNTVPYVELARQLGMTEGALNVAVHRLRHRFQEMLHAEVAQTVTGPAEVEEELRYLLRVAGG